METSKTAIRLTSSLCLLALAACGGGGGGGSVNTALNNQPANNSGTSSGNSSGSSGTSGTTTTPTPTVSIGAPDKPDVSIQGAPAFNFTTNLPPVGKVFGLLGPAVKITSTTV